MGLINKDLYSHLGWAGLVLLLWLYLIFFFNFNLVFIYIYIYILVIGNIMNKSLFMQVEIAKTCYYSAKLQ